MTATVHYQQGNRWPICFERLSNYDSTEALSEVTCPKCLDIITPTFLRDSGMAICEKCGKTIYEHPYMHFGILMLFRRCDGAWRKL